MMSTIAKRVAALPGGDGSRPRPDPAAVPSLASSASWSGWLFGAMAATVLLDAIVILADPLSTGISELFEKLAAGAVFFCAAALCGVKGRVAGKERSAWRLVGLAMAILGMAAVYYDVVLSDSRPVPAPSPADGLWLAFYVPAYIALYKMLRLRSRPVESGVWLDALVGALGVGGVAAALAFQGMLPRSHGGGLAAVVSVAYPLGDLGLLALVVGAITVTGWNAAGAWRWIATALAVFAVGDSIYGIQVAVGTYPIGGGLDLSWQAAALLVGVAAWGPETAPRSSVIAKRIIAMPALFGVAALAVLAVDHFVRLNPIALGLATASILAGLIRLSLAVRGNALMLAHSQRRAATVLAHSRRRAATDPLTGLGNRRQLRADLSERLAALGPDWPLMVTLFDLNGFKHYNDAFGHLAGDQLLQRLGARLRKVMATHGTAYRIAGDEFCALWNVSGDDPASANPADAAAALSEAGEAFSIDCCYGSALLPDDTTDPDDAVQIADGRMYAYKRRTHRSPGQQSSDVLIRALSERDSELGIHLGGVADLACATAIQLDLPREAVEATEQTALLHDVGKFAIPDRILNKRGPLDDSEWTFMKQHTLIGERIISAAPALASVAGFVRSTHERYDGAGYPDGLVGGAIPQIARIVAVCDAYDAIVTKRAYRDSRSTSLAIEELRRCSGTQFDPDVVDAVINRLEADPDCGALKQDDGRVALQEDDGRSETAGPGSGGVPPVPRRVSPPSWGLPSEGSAA